MVFARSLWVGFLLYIDSLEISFFLFCWRESSGGSSR